MKKKEISQVYNYCSVVKKTIIDKKVLNGKLLILNKQNFQTR